MTARVALPNLFASACKRSEKGWLAFQRIPFQIIVIERHHQRDCVTILHQDDILSIRGLNDLGR